MAASAATVDDRLTRKIHTAACLIIGDEVLGGKVSSVAAAHAELSRPRTRTD